MRNRRLALAAALLLAITSADGAALAVSGADFSSEEVAEAVFDEVENEGLDNQDEVQEQVQTPEMDQVEDQSSEDSFSDASGMEAAAEWQNEEAATADEALVFSDGEDTGFTEEESVSEEKTEQKAEASAKQFLMIILTLSAVCLLVAAIIFAIRKKRR